MFQVVCLFVCSVVSVCNVCCCTLHISAHTMSCCSCCTHVHHVFHYTNISSYHVLLLLLYPCIPCCPLHKYKLIPCLAAVAAPMYTMLPTPQISAHTIFCCYCYCTHVGSATIYPVWFFIRKIGASCKNYRPNKHPVWACLVFMILTNFCQCFVSLTRNGGSWSLLVLIMMSGPVVRQIGKQEIWNINHSCFFLLFCAASLLP